MNLYYSTACGSSDIQRKYLKGYGEGNGGGGRRRRETGRDRRRGKEEEEREEGEIWERNHGKTILLS